MSSLLVKALGGASMICLLVIMVLITGDVAWRTTMDVAPPLRGIPEYAEVLVVPIVWLGAAYTYRLSGHVSVDFLTVRLPPRAARVIRIAGVVVVLAFSLWLAYVTAVEAWRSFEFGERRAGIARVPIWPARISIALGSAALVLEAARHIVLLVRGDPTVANPDGMAGPETGSGGGPL